jgi:hypothetical protein
MPQLSDAQESLADADRMRAVDNDARESVRAAIEEHTVGAAHVLGDELPCLVAKDAQVLCRDIGIVDDDVVVVAAADARLRTGDAEAGRYVAVTRQDFHPDHLVACTALRKRLLSAMASS